MRNGAKRLKTAQNSAKRRQTAPDRARPRLVAPDRARPRLVAPDRTKNILMINLHNYYISKSNESKKILDNYSRGLC